MCFCSVAGTKVPKSKTFVKLRNIGKTMRDSKTAKSVSYYPYLIESLKDPEETAAYIEAVLEEGEPKLLQLVLRNVAEAHEGINKLSEQAKLNPEKLDKILSENGGSEIYSLVVLLDALGFKIAIAPK